MLLAKVSGSGLCIRVAIAVLVAMLSAGCQKNSATQSLDQLSTKKGDEMNTRFVGDLEEHLGERITLEGVAVSHKAGPYLEYKGIAIEILHQGAWPNSIEDKKVEISGRLLKIYRKDVKVDRNTPQVPHMGGGTWYALDDIKWKTVQKNNHTSEQ